MNQHASIPGSTHSYEHGDIQDSFSRLYNLSLPTPLDFDYERHGKGEYVFFATQDNAEGEPHAVHAEHDLETFEHWVMGLEALSVEEFAEEIIVRRDRYSEAEQAGWGNWSRGDRLVREIEARTAAAQPAPIPESPAPAVLDADSGPAYRFSQLADLCLAYPGLFADRGACTLHADGDSLNVFVRENAELSAITTALYEFGTDGWGGRNALGVGATHTQNAATPGMGFRSVTIFLDESAA